MASPPPPPPSGSGVDLQTLVITAAASALAAYVCSKIWAPGTLVSAAFTPVVVALIKEALRKPTDLVLATVPVPTPARRRGARGTQPAEVALPDEPLGGTPPPLPPPAAFPDGAAPVRVYSTRARRLRWRLALLTGLLGFGICIVLFTVPELLAGHAIGHAGRATTILGGHAGKKRTASPATTSTTKASTTATTTTQVTVTTTVPATTTAATPTTPAATTPSATTPTPTPGAAPAPDAQAAPATPTTAAPAAP